MSKKLIALLMAALMLLSVAAGCGKDNANIDQSTDGGQTAAPVQTGLKVYKTYLTSECTSLNFLDNVDSNAETVATYCMSYLWRAYPNEDGTNYIWIDDLAVGDPIQIDAYNWQIKLNEAGKWNDGTPINADTWMFTFEQQLNPKMAPRMSTFLADNAITILNATEYNLQGTEGYPQTVAWEDVGIKKVDEYTIQITTVDENTVDNVKKHFWNRNNVPVNQAMWEKCLSPDGLTTSYGSDLEHFVGCGPYTFSTWNYDSQHVYTKSPDHWMSKYFNYDEVNIRIVPQMNARVELFEQGELYSLTPDANTIETYLDDPRMTEYGSTSVIHIDINSQNPTNPISGNLNYRKAIYHSINREVVAESIFGHMEPVGTYVNAQAGMLSASALTYRDSKYGQAVTDMVESWGPFGYSPKLALEYLNKALEEEKVPEGTVIKIKMAFDESETAMKAFAEYLMEQWPTIFEGKMVLEAVPYAGMSATDFKATGVDKWDLSPNDWARGLSRTYPYACFYYYLSSYSGRPNNYTVPEFDAQYEVCDSLKNGDYDTLLAETQKLEELYLQYVIHVPVYQNVNYELFADCLQLPVKTYIPGFGWGSCYGDIVD